MEEMERLISLPEIKSNRQVRALGIDLGTTNSSVSEVIWTPGKPAVCRVLELAQPTQAGEYTSPIVPSILVELPDKQIWIGEGAKRLRLFCKKPIW